MHSGEEQGQFGDKKVEGENQINTGPWALLAKESDRGGQDQKGLKYSLRFWWGACLVW